MSKKKRKSESKQVFDMFVEIPDSQIVSRREISEIISTMHNTSTYKSICKVIGIKSATHVSRIARGYANPGNRVLEGLGMARQWTYYSVNGRGGHKK